MAPPQQIRTGTTRWWINGLSANEQIALLGPTGLRLEEWLQTGNAEVVKHAPYRTVYRIRLNDPCPIDVHVKHYHGDLREWCRQQMRGSRAWREYSLTLEVARRGVPTLEMLLCGESIHRRGSSHSYVVTRTLDQVESLLDFLLEKSLSPSGLHIEVRQRLSTAVGECLARIHRAGVRHEDLHPGNLLVRNPLVKPELYLIDLPDVQLGGPLSWKATRDNLVMLDRWFALRSSAPDRRRAWRAYCYERQELERDEQETVRELSSQTETTLRTHVGALDHRCLGGNRHFYRIRHRGLRGHAVSDLSKDAVAQFLYAGDALFDSPSGPVLKKSRSSTVVQINRPGGGSPVIAKRIKSIWSDPVASLFRATPLLRAYQMGHALRFRGLPTPRPLLVWHRCRGGLPGTGYLITEKVPHALPLDDAVTALCKQGNQDRRRLHKLIAETARIIRLLHRWGFRHRDLKASNLLVSPQQYRMGTRELREIAPQSTQDAVWLIDLVGLSKGVPPGRYRKMRDLARLHVSFHQCPILTRTDRLRFLRTYLRDGLADPTSWKEWWIGVEALGRSKLERNRRRGRPIG